MNNKNEKNCYILRGVPGSGKSTLAKTLTGEFGKIFSTDDLFMVDGKYCFDKSKLSAYHDINFLKFNQAIQRGENPVILDNTNIKFEHYERYKMEAAMQGYRVTIITLETPKVDVAFMRCVHGVPRDVIERMAIELYAQRRVAHE